MRWVLAGTLQVPKVTLFVAKRRTSTFLTELDDSEDETEDKEEASGMEMAP